MNWTDIHSARAFFSVAVLIFCVFFSPILRWDGILYVNPARSLIIDKDLNTINEDIYYSQPGWNDVSKRSITGRPALFVKYAATPDYTSRGYRHVVFPIGNALIWLPPMSIAHVLTTWTGGFHGRFSPDGFTRPYIVALGLWSFFLAVVGALIAYRFLRLWHSPAVACCAVLFVFATSNLIPFFTADVSFSHVIDFVLINLTAWVCAHVHRNLTGEQPIPDGNHASGPPVQAMLVLAGITCGWAVITRYQDIVLVCVPLVVISLHGLLRHRNQFHPAGSGTHFPVRHLVVFVSSFTLAISLQLVYWIIQFGTIPMSGSTIGTGDLPSFNLLNPQMVAMFFSRFHGLFSWMPWLLPLMLAACLFYRRNRVLGCLFAAVFIAQIYYNATRTEWWNMGFSVRRFSGWILVFMVGAAELFGFVKRRLTRWIGAILGIGIILWHWFFMIHYLMGRHPQGLLSKMLSGTGPYGRDQYGLMIPKLNWFVEGWAGGVSWFQSTAWTAAIWEAWNAGDRVDVLGQAIVYVCFFLGIGMVCRYGTSGKWNGWRVGAIAAVVACAGSAILLIYADLNAENRWFQTIRRGVVTPCHQVLRMNPAIDYTGGNDFVTMDPDGIICHLPPGMRSGSCEWMVGIPVADLPATQPTVEVISPEGVLHRCIGDNPVDSCRRLTRPWGDVHYQHVWYTGSFRVAETVPGSGDWVVRCPGITGAKLAALSYRPDCD
ncbi:hypothetical protein JXA80_06055 [bacterium]|nr:hypothetical protein [candidate division CSSED10-310 bacterium]